MFIKTEGEDAGRGEENKEKVRDGQRVCPHAPTRAGLCPAGSEGPL